MLITEFSYYREHWNLNRIFLQDLTLLVGANAVGKSKTINAINTVAGIISGRVQLNLRSTFSTKLKLKDGEDAFIYELSVMNASVVSESLVVNGEVKIQREGNSAKFYGDEVNPPLSRLLLGSRRDTELYPDIEKLMEFFDRVSLFSFSNVIPGERVLDPITIGGLDIAGMFSNLSEEDRQSIIELLNDLGFKVGNLHSVRAMGKSLIAMKEEGVGSEFVMWAFSTGLIRVVAMLTYLYHLSVDSKGGLILIDDLGEGLDYHRSTKLGKHVCDFCGDKGIQVVLTTNDSFLMNVIDIDCWNILSRKGSVVSSVSRGTDPDLFDSFKLTGLSNYDLFRSDFMERFKRS